MAQQRAQLLKAAGFGVSAALLLGGMFVLFSGLRASFGGTDCEGLSTTECAFAHETAVTVGRLQILFGGAMIALGIALYVIWRTMKPTSAPTDSEKETPP